ncbi:putative sporulation protein YtxC [Paenibacillus xerothermodurans]|uniref:Sporulation protein YtxC n=1 Tax=Paenibacillus xerothermodurans TaxID=1977292 RepID=A0A2W1NLN4_PAEXE|nr:putative sporulation protein YtxC [Paenibacillus xerothermodurans]PZE20355.1 putative sporulation protein YtxC [Paenibacillus xerothermodurans]
MKLLTLTIMRAADEAVERFYQAVAAAVHEVHKNHAVTELQDNAGYSVIQVSGVLPRFQLDKRMDAMHVKIAGAVADWIIANEEDDLLVSLIAKEFHYEHPDDIRCILKYCHQNNRIDAEEAPQVQQKPAHNRRYKIVQAIYSYLQQNEHLNIDGFLTFRLDDYVEELHDLAEYAVDEFVMDQQYQEFISLLKYFVYIQEAKIPFAHLLHKGGSEFTLLNDRMEPIDTTDCDATLTIEMLEKDINFEDIIVSTLISVSPEIIYIHTRDPHVQIIQTIMQIFENRVELCQYCRLCQNLDRTVAADYNEL